jgi:opacity protein-like surface antigen
MKNSFIKLAIVSGLITIQSLFAQEFFVKPTYGYVKSDIYGSANYYGVNTGFYLNENKTHEVSFDFGLVNTHLEETYYNTPFSFNQRFSTNILNYRYHFKGEDSLSKTSFYVGPSFGFISATLDVDNQYFKFNDSETGFVYGATAGVVIPLSKHWKMDLGYKFLQAPSISFETEDYILSSEETKLHIASIGFAFNF